ncbi:MAG TPA: class I SAM-dependent methyltransferase [Hyphomicrobiaceae bacterium]|nr:class I SAM-dependent methyltransferase [Hyphomicrobiaceae bacterium]
MDIAHQQVLDSNYRFQRHVYNVTRRYYLLGRDRLISELAVPPEANVLEIGCGTARNLVRLAECYPEAQFWGIDLSCAMLATAGKAVARRGLSGRVTLAHADAACFDPRLTFGRETFDRIVFSYTLSMIPDWQLAIKQAAACLAPSGSIQIVDFGSGRRLPATVRRALRAWLRRFHVTPRDDLVPFLGRVAEGGQYELFAEETYRTYAVRAVLTSAPSVG